MTGMPKYTRWLEELAKRLLQEPEHVTGIAVSIICNDGTIETGYWGCGMMDKVLIAGMIQQDAMLDTLAANAEVEEEDTDEESYKDD